MEEISNELKQMKHEVKQLRSEMKKMREEMKQVISESKPNAENLWSIRRVFSQSYLDGLRELANESLSSIVKIFWFSVLIVNLMLLTYQITEITKDYAEEVIITQISQTKTNLTKLNQPSVCYSIFPDFLYRQSDSNSLDELEPLDNASLLYLGYIKAMIPHFASSGLWLSHIPSENITWSQFQSFSARPWLSMSKENASHLSQNTLYDSLYSWGIGRLNDVNDSKLPDGRQHVSQSKLSYIQKFYSDVLSGVKSLNGAMQSWEAESWICVPINLSTTNEISFNGKNVNWFSYGHYFGEPANRKILKEMELSVIHFNTKYYPWDNPYARSKLDSNFVYKRDSVSYTLMPKKFQHRNLTRRKCYDAKGEIYPRGYGDSICFHDCLWENHPKLFNCSFWEDMNIYKAHQSMMVCHIFDILDQVRSYMSQMCLSDGNQVWCNNETSFRVDAWNGLILQSYRDRVINEGRQIGCEQKCAGWIFCDEWELEYTILNKQETAERSKSVSNWSGYEMRRSYSFSHFVSVNKEVLKASFEEFIADLGGTIGFYFGFSICGCLHLLLFLSINCCGKVLAQTKRRHTQVADDQPTAAGSLDNFKNIGMMEIQQIEEPI